jgi:hypothetical protein
MYRDTICILSDHRGETLAHITCSILCERETEDVRREVVGRLEYVGYTGGEELSLAAPWSGDDKHGSIYRLDGFELFFIQGCEDILEIHR